MKIFRKIANIKIKILKIFIFFLSFILIFDKYNNKMNSFFFKNKLEKKNQNILDSASLKEPLNKICPKKVSTLPKNSTLIIGHAYGSQKNSDLRGNVGIAPKVYNFYLENLENIDSIIFSGDVLKVPNIKKWKNFYSKFNENTKIYIAPGNHDVGGKYFDSALRDVFNIIYHKNQDGFKFPFKLIINNSLFIIGDSNSKESSLDQII